MAAINAMVFLILITRFEIMFLSYDVWLSVRNSTLNELAMQVWTNRFCLLK